MKKIFIFAVVLISCLSLSFAQTSQIPGGYVSLYSALAGQSSYEKAGTTINATSNMQIIGPGSGWDQSTALAVSNYEKLEFKFKFNVADAGHQIVIRYSVNKSVKYKLVTFPNDGSTECVFTINTHTADLPADANGIVGMGGIIIYNGNTHYSFSYTGTPTIQAITLNYVALKTALPTAITVVPTDAVLAQALPVGQTTTLTAQFMPVYTTNKAVIWSSENDGIATVDASTGVVTGVTAGSVKITAISGEDSSIKGDYTITVAASTVAVTGVELALSTLSLKMMNNATLAYTVSPGDASKRNVTWTSSEPTVATVDGTGKVTSVGAGTTTITVKTEDGEFTDACEVTVIGYLPIPEGYVSLYTLNYMFDGASESLSGNKGATLPAIFSSNGGSLLGWSSNWNRNNRYVDLANYAELQIACYFKTEDIGKTFDLRYCFSGTPEDATSTTLIQPAIVITSENQKITIDLANDEGDIENLRRLGAIKFRNGASGEVKFNVDYVAIKQKLLPTFTGTGNWSDGTWSITPVEGNDVIIDGNVTVDTDVNIGNLTINAEKSVIVAAGKQLTATGALVNNGTFTLKSDAFNGTATLLTQGAITTGDEAAVSVEQYLAGKTGASGREWWYVSSPVNGAKITIFNTNGNSIGYYNEATVSYTDPITAEENLAVGRGYVLNLAGDDAIYTFSGELNNGTVSVSVSRTGTSAAKRGFNLVGNPYPSYLEWDNVTKTNVMPTIWTRSLVEGEMQFLTYNADAEVGVPDETTKHIAPMQAFWVKVLDDKADVTGLTLDFTNATRSHKGASGYGILRAPKAETRQIVRLQVSNGTNADNAVILFDDRAGNGFEHFDSEKMSNCNAAIPEIYTLAGSEKLVINSMSTVPSSSEEIVLGFNTGATGSFTIQATAVKNIGDELKVILKDKIQNANFDLTDGNAYQFTTDAANTESRFAIVFAPKTVTGIFENSAGKTLVYVSNGKIKIENGKSGDKVEIVNVAGQKLYEQTLSGKLSMVDYQLSAGVYFVKTGNETTKVVVR